jgi:hypothetical protein
VENAVLDRIQMEWLREKRRPRGRVAKESKRKVEEH